jgi:hypothetical protein
MTEEARSAPEIMANLTKVINTKGPDDYVSTISNVPRHIVLIYAIHMCVCEVNNGGFLQLFWNSIGVLVPEAIEGFKTIGMPSMAAILREAAQPLGDPYPRDRDERWDALLAASGCNTEEIERIFKNAKNYYLGFQEATLALSFDALNQRFWECAKTEGGGFQEAATRYAQHPHLIQ